MVKGNTAGIRRSLKEGLLGDASNVLISLNKGGEFEPLKSHPEFRDLVVTAAALPTGPGAKAAIPVSPVSNPATPVTLTTKTPSSGSGLHDAPPQPAKPTSASKVGIPHIRLEPTRRGPDWIKLAIWLGLAVVVSVILTLLLQ
jgi:hypothetical protein